MIQDVVPSIQPSFRLRRLTPGGTTGKKFILCSLRRTWSATSWVSLHPPDFYGHAGDKKPPEGKK